MYHTSNHAVQAIKVRAWNITNEELWAICVWTSICHRNKTLVTMFNPNTFIWEFASINALVTLSIRCNDLASLHHKLRDDSLNLATFIKKICAHLSSTKCSKVLNSFWQEILEQFNNDPLFHKAWLAFLPNLYVHPCLYMVDTKRRHRSTAIVWIDVAYVNEGPFCCCYFFIFN